MTAFLIVVACALVALSAAALLLLWVAVRRDRRDLTNATFMELPDVERALRAARKREAPHQQ